MTALARNAATSAVILRAELRRRWRAWVLLGILSGIAAGAVLSAVAGTRRTSTSFDRMVAATRAPDLTIDADAEVAEAVGSLPGVAEIDRVTGLQLVLPVVDGRLTNLVGDALVAVVDDDDLARELGGALIVEGRQPIAGRHEVVMNSSWEESMGIHVGDEVPLYNFVALAEAGRLPERFEDLADAVQEDPSLARRVVVHVVGRFVRYVDVARDAASRPAYIVLDRATAVELSGLSDGDADRLFEGGMTIAVRYERGADEPEVVERIRSLPMRPTRLTRLVDVRGAVVDATRPYVGALVALAILTAVCGLTVVGAALARQSASDADGDHVLWSLGAGASLLRAIRTGRAIVIALVALLVATCVVVVTSPVFPIGPTAGTEPRPGVNIDAVVLVPGLVGTAVFVVAVSAAGARLSNPRHIRARRGRSHPGARLLPLPVAIGTTLAFGGSGHTRVVMRSAILAMTVSILTGSALATFAGGVGRLLQQPADYGWSGDAALTCNQGYCQLDPNDIGPRLERTGLIDRWTFASFSSVSAGGRSIPAVAATFGRGDLATASIVEGRAPVADDEVAFGASVMKRLDARLGDTVAIDDSESPGLEVVGIAVFPGFGLADEPRPSLGEGALLTSPGLRRVGAEFDSLPHAVFVAGPADSDRVADALGEEFRGFSVVRDPRPGAVQSWSSLGVLPLVLGALIAALLVGTLAHALALSARLRRAELGVLAALGLTPRQLRRALHWQTAALMAVSTVLGAPLGYVIGRVAWSTTTSRLGMRVADRVTMASPALVIALACLFAAVVALVLGRLVSPHAETRARE